MGEFPKLQKRDDESLTEGIDIPAYDILNDLCVKYAKEVFGDVDICFPGKFDSDIPSVAYIIRLLQDGDKEGAEAYIEKHSIIFKA